MGTSKHGGDGVAVRKDGDQDWRYGRKQAEREDEALVGGREEQKGRKMEEERATKRERPERYNKDRKEC